MGDREIGGKRFSGSEKSVLFLRACGRSRFCLRELRVIQSRDSDADRQRHRRNDTFLFERQTARCHLKRRKAADGHCFCLCYETKSFCVRRANRQPRCRRNKTACANAEGIKGAGIYLAHRRAPDRLAHGDRGPVFVSAGGKNRARICPKGLASSAGDGYASYGPTRVA